MRGHILRLGANMGALTIHSLPATTAVTITKAVGCSRGSVALIDGGTIRRCTTICKAESRGNRTVELAAGAGGLVSSATVAWSLYTLKTTGCGLPPGPGGAFGAAEGVSYLAVAALIGWSLITKARTGSGLPAGPFGLLGAAEGVAYLAVVAIVVIFGLQFLEQGSIPGPLPSEQCFG